MNVHKRLWILTALLLCGVAYLAWSGMITLVLTKFSDPNVRILISVVIGTFLYAYCYGGLRAAKIIARNEDALAEFKRGVGNFSGSELGEYLRETLVLRGKGFRNNPDGSFLPQLLADAQERDLEKVLGNNIFIVDNFRDGYFLAGILFTATAIVLAFAFMTPSSDIEELRINSTVILETLGKAYIPALACLCSLFILYLTGTTLATHQRRLVDEAGRLIRGAAVFAEIGGTHYET